MKRSRDCCGDAAMLALKTCEGFQGRRIADHARDLPAAGDVFRLPLGAGFGGGHGLGQERVAHFADFLACEQVAIVGRDVLGKAVCHQRAVEVGNRGRRCGGALLGPADVVGAGSDSGGFLGIHGWLPLTVGPSYNVTSDQSTTVRREIQEAA